MARKPKNKTNWDKIRNQATEDNARFRDVYEEQQLDRSYIDKKQTMTSRMILAAAAGLFTLIVIWALVAQVERTGVLDGLNRGWYSVFYKHDGEKSDYQYVTFRTSEQVFEEDGVTPVLDEDGNPTYNDTFERYIVYIPTGVLTDISHSKVPVYTGCGNASYDENDKLVYDPATVKPVAPEGEPNPRIYIHMDTSGWANKFEGQEGFLGRTSEYGYVFDVSAREYLFDYDETELTDAGQQILASVLPIYCNVLLQEEYFPYLAEIIIDGYTDSSGGYEYNLQLSQERSLAVANYLLELSADTLNSEEQESLRDHLTVNGHSSSNLILDEEGNENADASRRVEVKFRLKDEEMIEELRAILDT